MSDKIIVMQKDGVSYVKLVSYGNFSGNHYVINGEPAVQADGDKTYAVVNGVVTSIERKVTPQRNRIGFVLIERYREITQLPHELPLGAFVYDDDGDLCGENAEFYRGIFDDPQPYLEAVEFDIIDRDCEPVNMPSYVVIEFPNNIAKYRETQHKYPCYVSSETAFNLLWDRVKEHVTASNGIYVIDDYKSIQALRVQERINIPYHETKQRSYYPTQRSRKMKTETVPVTQKLVKVIEIYGPKYGQDAAGKQRTQTIRGVNYADLQTNVESYIQSFLTQLADGKREVCRHCRGEGIVEVLAEVYA
jgi:hypothetical protein